MHKFINELGMISNVENRIKLFYETNIVIQISKGRNAHNMSKRITSKVPHDKRSLSTMERCWLTG